MGEGQEGVFRAQRGLERQSELLKGQGWLTVRDCTPQGGGTEALLGTHSAWGRCGSSGWGYRQSAPRGSTELQGASSRKLKGRAISRGLDAPGCQQTKWAGNPGTLSPARNRPQT